ncbi:Cobalt-zinc-cadmium resistance protein CzcB [Rosistilla carotiformis]|uniref:Cobalt-zinc-cadmium resistance protein CzcB n=1 Tax=Rosistilla carotiformis TaxID=2528017 RepID=A0A518JRV5_9BACT|nr:efflux RND transporter periplasmic adaptor subunit [Rosistilla carotiformis]QDV68268.1 Cobalt-zinc-cadmium resistance protein CzcB [Rosistilla carotiformis]
MTHRSLQFLLAVVTLASLPCQACVAQAGSPAAVSDYEYNPIEGFSQPFRTARVATSVSGIVEALAVAEGSEVRENDCLVELDSSVHEELLAISRTAMQARGELATAQAELTARRSRLERIESLAARQHATPVELLQAREQVALAEANVLSTQEKQLQRTAEFKKLTAEANQFCITAPFDGVIVRFLKEEGEYVGAVDPEVCVLAQLNVLSVNFLVPRDRRDEFELGGQATILFLDSKRRASGAICFVSPFPDGETNMFNVKVRVDNVDRTLNAGSRCHLLSLDGNPNDLGAPQPQLTMQLK